MWGMIVKRIEDLPAWLPGQADLFGEPEKLPELSQWHTPMPLARKLAQWVPPTARVLEPSAGAGNLIRALLERGHPANLIHAVELDRRWCEVLVRDFPGIEVIHGDFLRLGMSRDAFDVCAMNPPFEGTLAHEFALEALRVAYRVVGVFKEAFEFGDERDRELWRPRAKVTRRARLPNRVKYGGANQASFDTIVLDISRRSRPRADDEITTVVEEVWSL
jgi:predicted RNA methylase